MSSSSLPLVSKYDTSCTRTLIWSCAKDRAEHTPDENGIRTRSIVPTVQNTQHRCNTHNSPDYSSLTLTPWIEVIADRSWILIRSVESPHCSSRSPPWSRTIYRLYAKHRTSQNISHTNSAYIHLHDSNRNDAEYDHDTDHTILPEHPVVHIFEDSNCKPYLRNTTRKNAIASVSESE